MAVDWESVKLQYEIYHEKAENLAQENDISMDMLNYAIESQGWKRAPINGLMHEVRDISNLESCSEDVMDSIQERLGIVNVLKSATMNPKYIALETAILVKAKEIVKAIESRAVNSGDQLKKISEVLEKLRLSSIPAALRGEDGGKNDNRITVQILNQAQTQIADQKPSSEVVVQQ